MFESTHQNKLSVTDNGAIALKTSGNCNVDYFMMFTRTLQQIQHHKYLQDCWKSNPEYTVATIFNGRDRQNGKKEKKVSNEAMMWLRKNKPKTYIQNIDNYVNKYGCWKDLLYISYHLNKSYEVLDKNYELKLFSQQLQKDKVLLDSDETNSVSLCGKWAPSEQDRNDKRKQFAKKLATLLYSRDDNKKMEKYRKEYLVPLRKKINIVENLICKNEWDKIKYETVPGVASKKLLNAFKKHDAERYAEYLKEVKSGTKEIKITGLLPHDLLKYYIDSKDNVQNETIEMQFKTMIDNIRSRGTLKSALPIVDLSGSMFSARNGDIPARVAASLGIITALCCQEPFYKKVITFSDTPSFIDLPNETLFDCYNAIKNVNYGLNTDFLKTCRTIIDYAVNNNISNDDMIDKLIVFTDMQFDEATSDDKELNTLYATITNMFRQSNYTPPKFIFWNLNSENGETFPVDVSVNNTAMVSGFSEQLLKIFMEHDEFNPILIVDEILKPYLTNVQICEDER